MASSYTTHRRQLYMLPTKTGWIFSMMVFVLLLTSIKFNHQPTFLLTFLLASIGFISALHTHKNLNHLKINYKNSANIFAEDYAQFPLSIHNSSDTIRHNIWIICERFNSCISLNPNSIKSTSIKLKIAKRGRFKLPPVSISSHFPIGILFSWSRPFDANVECLVYPKPVDSLQQTIPPYSTVDNTGNESNTVTNSNNNEQISSLKTYQSGDRLRDIHWPTLAKNNQLLSKEYESSSEQKLIFRWEHVASLDTEDKISQLTFWLLEADKQGIQYQLSIPGFESGFESRNSAGNTHLINCLEQLAVWQD